MVKIVAWTFCLLVLLGTAACVSGPGGHPQFPNLDTPLERWDAGDWALGSLGFVTGFVFAAVCTAGIVVLAALSVLGGM